MDGAAAGSARNTPRTGVVSDDDDGYPYQHIQENLQHNIGDTKRNEYTAATASTASTMSNQKHEERDRRQQHHNTNSKNNTSTKNTTTTHNPNSKNIDNKKQDDTIGHFQGRDGCVIANRYRFLKEVGVGTFGRVVECLDIKRRRGRRQDREDDDRHYYRRENERGHHHNHHKSHPQHHHSRYHSSQHRESIHNEHDNDPKNIVAIKIVRNVKRYYESAKIEADIIEDVNRRGKRGVTHCAIMYDTFSFQGHYCMVFECLGPSLYDFLKGQKYHPFPIYCVRDFAKQLLETLEFLHSFRLIHTDLKVRAFVRG